MFAFGVCESSFFCVCVGVLVYFPWDIWFFCCSWWIASDSFSFLIRWNDQEIREKKTVPNTEEETKVCALFSIVFKCSETDRIATMAQSTKFRINRKQTRRMLENVEILLNVSFFFGSAYSLLILVTFFFSCGCLSNSLTSVFFVLYL